jgi:ribonuclease P protein component
MISSLFKIKKGQFPAVMHGIHIHNIYLKVIVSKKIQDKTQCSVIISKKFYKKAVHRNYIKRVLYHSFNEIKDSVPKKTYVLLVIKKIPPIDGGKKDTFDKKNIHQELKKDFDQLFHKILSHE